MCHCLSLSERKANFSVTTIKFRKNAHPKYRHQAKNTGWAIFWLRCEKLEKEAQPTKIQKKKYQMGELSAEVREGQISDRINTSTLFAHILFTHRR